MGSDTVRGHYGNVLVLSQRDSPGRLKRIRMGCGEVLVMKKPGKISAEIPPGAKRVLEHAARKTAGTPGRGSTRFMGAATVSVHWGTISDALACGMPLSRIWETLCDEENLKLGYRAFVKRVRLHEDMVKRAAQHRRAMEATAELIVRAIDKTPVTIDPRTADRPVTKSGDFQIGLYRAWTDRSPV